MELGRGRSEVRFGAVEVRRGSLWEEGSADDIVRDGMDGMCQV